MSTDRVNNPCATRAIAIRYAYVNAARHAGECVMLEEEIGYYEECLPIWLERHEGRVVLVKGRELIGFFDTEREAVAEGVGQFGLTSFLVRRVLEVQPVVYVPALEHGVLRADLQFLVPDED
jgi:hypothetical protein